MLRNCSDTKRRCVLIEGAGIAGQVLHHELHALGIPSRIADNRSFPRDKVCGGVLQPDSWRYLSSAFRIESKTTYIRRISHFWRMRRLGSYLLDEPLVFVARLGLDYDLWRQKAESAEFEESVRVRAAGAASPDGEWLGFHGAAAPVEGLEMRYGRGIYAGVSQTPEGPSHVAFLVKRSLYKNPEELKTFVARELGIRLEGPIKGTSRIRYGYTDADLAVGDAKLTTHPFLGLGMKHAILSAKLLAQLIAEGREKDYDALHRKAFRRMHWASRAGEMLFETSLRPLVRPFLSIEPIFRFSYAWIHEGGNLTSS